MNDYFELDFLEAGENKSGDAILFRYGDHDTGTQTIHVIDGGYTDDGARLESLLTEFYGEPSRIDNVVLTHPDGDHAKGLVQILNNYEVGALWMNRPWLYVDELMSRFEYPYTRDGLIKKLKEAFNHTAELERIALSKNVTIMPVFQGAQIGQFRVLSPTKNLYLDLVVNSDRTPEPETEKTFAERLASGLTKAFNYVVKQWGEENLKGEAEGTSEENEMSVVQYAEIRGEKILLTADAGIINLRQAYDYAISIGINLPGVDRFQVPHHGSRRNLSSEILDLWLGTKKQARDEHTVFTAIISANEKDEDHPRKDVVRAMHHRGGKVFSTEGKDSMRSSNNASVRPTYRETVSVDYPEESEE